MKPLLYLLLVAGWLDALRREAARLRWLAWLYSWCNDIEDFAVRVAAGWTVKAQTPEPVRLPPRMTSSGDAASGMTIAELLQDAP